MKSMTNKNNRGSLLEKLRMAVCIQIKFWDACAEVEDILGDGDDVVSLVERVALKRCLGGNSILPTWPQYKPASGREIPLPQGGD